MRRESGSIRIRSARMNRTPSIPLSAGDKLGPYEIVAPLGAGGMGEVYNARDTRLDSIVAIKTAHERFSERYEREARAVAALNHPTCASFTTSVRTTW